MSGQIAGATAPLLSQTLNGMLALVWTLGGSAAASLHFKIGLTEHTGNALAVTALGESTSQFVLGIASDTYSALLCLQLVCRRGFTTLRRLAGLIGNADSVCGCFLSPKGEETSRSKQQDVQPASVNVGSSQQL